MLKFTNVMMLSMTVGLVACNGGGGSSSGDSGGEGNSGFGGFYVDSSSSVGTTCMNYVMTASKCTSIGGNWNSTPVDARYTCANPINATTGKCHLDGLKFTASAQPLSAEAIQTCEDLGGVISPNNQTDCESASGSWVEETAATNVSSCSKAPSDEVECAAVGGSYGEFRVVTGGLVPSIEGMDAGQSLVFVNNEEPTDYISGGTSIASISGTVKLYGVNDFLWQAAAPVNRASDFRTQADGKTYFHLNLGRDFTHEDNVNGVSVVLEIYYR